MRAAQRVAIGQRADRQLVMVVGPHGEVPGSLVELQHELAGIELDAVLIAEHGHEQLVVQVTAMRLPIDVEPARVSRLRAPLEHVEPQWIVGSADAHVVRHEIEKDLEAGARERSDHGVELRRRAELGVQRIVRDDVVAVRAAGPRLQDRRRVNMRDAEPPQIRCQRRRGREPQLRVQLEPVRRERAHRCSLQSGASGGSFSFSNSSERAATGINVTDRVFVIGIIRRRLELRVEQ